MSYSHAIIWNLNNFEKDDSIHRRVNRYISKNKCLWHQLQSLGFMQALNICLRAFKICASGFVNVSLNLCLYMHVMKVIKDTY